MKKLVVLLFIFGVQISQAITIGRNGGGSAEMKALDQYEALPLWSRFCDQNLHLCLNSESQQDYLTIRNWTVDIQGTQLAFLDNAAESSKLSKNLIGILRSDLYSSPTEAKSALQIFEILLTSIAKTKNPQANLKALFAPLSSHIHPNSLIAVLQVTSFEDYLVDPSGQFNLHSYLVQKLGSKYKVVGSMADGYLVRSTLSVQVYAVYASEQSGRTRFQVRSYIE